MKKLLAGLLAICMLTCTACGSQDVGNTDTSTLRCPQCGVGMAETDKFCGSCGYAVGAIITTEAPTTTQLDENDGIRDTSERETTTTQNVAASTTKNGVSSTTKKTTTIKKSTQSTTKKVTTKQPASTQAGHVHSWSAATCEKPKTCECGATSGEAIGHFYLAATCTEAEKCTRCEQTKGKPLGHIPKNQQTCTSDDKCSRCNYWIDDTALGHNYNKSGICTRCKDTDPNHTVTLKLGETWVVDGLWEVTITSVSKHYACNHFNDHTGLVYTFNYTYKNLGYTDYEGKDLLEIWSTDFEIYDEQGRAGGAYPCIHTAESKKVRTGMSCSAGLGIALNNESDKITIILGLNTVQRWPYTSYLYAKWELDV